MSLSRLDFVTVVSGLPRSGTSMMMRMIEAGGVPVLTDGIRHADEDNLQGYLEFEPVKRIRQDTSWLDDATGKVVKVIAMLLTDLPPGHRYRVVFMQRPYSEVLASQQVMLDRRGEKGSALKSEALADVFDRQLVKTRTWLADQPNFDVLYVDYHDVISDPLKQTDRVCEFLCAQLNAEAMASVVDESLYRQRRR